MTHQVVVRKNVKGFRRLWLRLKRWTFSLYHDFVCGSDFRLRGIDVRCGECGRTFDRP